MSDFNQDLKLTVHNWLAEEQSQKELHNQAKILLKKIDRMTLPESVHPFAGMDHDDKYHESYLELSNATKLVIAKISLLELNSLKEKGIKTILTLASKKYFYQLKERNRQKKHNPWGYTYKRARTIFADKKKNPPFTKVRDKKVIKYSLYSFEKDNLLADDPSYYPEDKKEYADWSSPTMLVSREDCYPAKSKFPKEEQTPYFKRKHLLELGRLFWEEHKIKYGRHYYLHIKEFTFYLSAFYAWMLPPQLLSYDDLDDYELSKTYQPLSNHNEKGIRSLATELTYAWDDLSRDIFYKKEFASPPLSNSAIAKEHETTVNKIKALHARCHEHYVNFCNTDNIGEPISSWPETDIREFIAEVGFFCKISKSGHKEFIEGGTCHEQ